MNRCRKDNEFQVNRVVITTKEKNIERFSQCVSVSQCKEINLIIVICLFILFPTIKSGLKPLTKKEKYTIIIIADVNPFWITFNLTLLGWIVRLIVS